MSNQLKCHQNAHTFCGHFVFFTVVLISLLTTISGRTQTSLRPYAAILFAGDGAFEFYGPSVMVGADMPVNLKYDISASIQFFGDRSAYGSFTTTSLAVLYQRYFFGDSRRFYAGVGLSLQHATKDYIIPEEVFNRLIVTGAYRLGYAIHGKKWAFCPEINTSGPYSYEIKFDQGGTIIVSEMFTLPSIGIRIYSIKRDGSGRKIRGI